MNAAQLSVKDIERSVAGFIDREGLLRPDAPVLVALSGGADSVCLLAVLTALGYPCVAAHCNFGLRGAESNRDMEHCRTVAARLGVDLFVRRFDVPARMKQTGESLEMACRSLRYEWFEKLATAEHAQAVAVGHHTEDRAETFFLNLMRGAGITGLTSMNARNGDVVRPLLELTRSDIEAYLQLRGLEYVDDSSNATTDYRRNHIRHRVLPALAEEFPGAIDAVIRSMSNLAAARDIYREAVEAKRRRYFADGSTIDLDALADERRADTLLLEFLAPAGFNHAQCADMLARRSASGIRFFAGGGHGAVAEISRGRLSLCDVSRLGVDDDAVEVNLGRDISSPLTITVDIDAVENFRPAADARCLWLDADKALAPDRRWYLRHWRHGDRMALFGGGSKLVSDIFTDAHLDAQEKRNVWLLCTAEGDVAWVVGLRAGAIFPVEPGTRRFIKLTLNS